jgi:Pectate lyase superfamily protein
MRKPKDLSPARTKRLPIGRARRAAFCCGIWLLTCGSAAAESRPPEPEAGTTARREQPATGAFDQNDIRMRIAKVLRRRVEEVPSNVVSVKDFGARGDGASDDAAAIERAVRYLHSGGIVAFPAGTYVQGRSIRVESRNVILWGADAQLHASNPMDQALGLIGEGSAVIGLTFTANTNVRAADLPQTRIVLAGKGNVALNNIIDGASSAGIMVFGGRDFKVEGNTVRNTLADGIHITNGAYGGVVVGNVVRASQDDMIAVVSYGRGQAAHDILIAHNDVAGNPWGRGIAVVGGRDITVSDNTIRDVVAGAGVLIAREGFWNTNGTSNVLIERNLLERIQTQGNVLGGRPRTGQGAIEVYSDGKGDRELAVRTLLIRDNEIRGSLAEGVRIIGNVCQIELADNRFDGVGGPFLGVADLNCSDPVVSCQGNRRNGAPTSAPICGSFASGASGAAARE